jgi:TATA-binding protein-associated factor
VEAVAYGGSAAHRNATLGSLDGSDKLLVVSYEAVRGDIELFLSRRDPSWNFAVLDEGHIIKNPKSKLTQAVKRVGLGAAHRLILTGTPIQNNVLELWGLFDFLMPSFLGSDRDFNSRYRWQFVSACLPTCMYVRRHACGAADSRVTDVSDTVAEVSHAMTEVSHV